jgi:threonine dehydrogenase-like Zn-dependent dehydrogenase
MKALQLQAVGRVELIDIPVPRPGEGQLLLRTGAAVICTSDLNDVRSNPFGIALPVIMGHEGAGTVEQVAPGVSGFTIGDRVAAHPVHPCGRCWNCRAGMRHLCADMGHFGLNMQGVFAEAFLVRADRARVVPAEVPFAAAALAEPICVCLESLAQARVARGGSLLIIGDGPFGVLTAMLARELELARLVIAGHHSFRLGFASGAVAVNTGAGASSMDVPPMSTTGVPPVVGHNGPGPEAPATHGQDAHATKNAADALATMKAHAPAGGYDAVILAVGRAEAVRQGLELLRPKGRLVVFSAIPGQTPVDLFSLHVKELEIVGACNDQERLDAAVERLGADWAELGRLVTHRLPLTEYRRAFELAGGAHGQVMKVAFEF